jgi:hypothetical protein
MCRDFYTTMECSNGKIPEYTAIDNKMYHSVKFSEFWYIQAHDHCMFFHMCIGFNTFNACVQLKEYKVVDNKKLFRQMI